MLVVMKQSATPDQIERVCAWIREKGYTAQPMPGAQRTAIGLVGNDGRVVKLWVDREGYEQGPLFDCLSEKARSMKFPSFQGERPTVSLA